MERRDCGVLWVVDDGVRGKVCAIGVTRGEPVQWHACGDEWGMEIRALCIGLVRRIVVLQLPHIVPGEGHGCGYGHGYVYGDAYG